MATSTEVSSLFIFIENYPLMLWQILVGLIGITANDDLHCQRKLFPFYACLQSRVIVLRQPMLAKCYLTLTWARHRLLGISLISFAILFIRYFSSTMTLHLAIYQLYFISYCNCYVVVTDIFNRRLLQPLRKNRLKRFRPWREKRDYENFESYISKG